MTTTLKATKALSFFIQRKAWLKREVSFKHGLAEKILFTKKSLYIFFTTKKPLKLKAGGTQ